VLCQLLFNRLIQRWQIKVKGIFKLSDKDKKSYAQILELIAAIKKKLSQRFRSESADMQAIKDLKLAIATSKKKDILDSNGVSIYDKVLNDFECWINEVELEELAA
jgi:hypothetical protein